MKFSCCSTWGVCFQNKLRLVDAISFVIDRINIDIDKIHSGLCGFHRKKNRFSSHPLPCGRNLKRNFLVNAIHLTRSEELLIIGTQRV